MDLKTSQFGTITATQADSAGVEGYLPYVDPSQVDPDLRNKRMTRSEAKKFFGLDVFTALSGTSWDGNNKTLTLTSNTALTFSSTKRNGILRVKQDGTGGRTLSINSISVPIASGANAITAIGFFYDDVAATYVFSYDTNILGNVGGGGGGLTQLATPTLVANVISSTQIDLSWTNVANESSYKLEWSPNGTSGWTQIGGTIAANTTNYSHTGLTASTHYYYRVTAVGDGVTYSDSGFGTDDDTTSAAGPSLEAVNFNLHDTNLVNDGSGNWVSSGPGFGKVGTQTTKKLAAGNDGYIEFDYSASDCDFAIVGFTSGTTLISGYTAATFYAIFTNSGNLSVINAGTNTAVGPTITSAAGKKLRVERAGSVVKAKYYDGATWSDVFTFNTTTHADLLGDLLPACDSQGGTVVRQPKAYNLT